MGATSKSWFAFSDHFPLTQCSSREVKYISPPTKPTQHPHPPFLKPPRSIILTLLTSSLVPPPNVLRLPRLLRQHPPSKTVRSFPVSDTSAHTRHHSTRSMALSGARMVGRRRQLQFRASPRYSYIRSARGCRGNVHIVSCYGRIFMLILMGRCLGWRMCLVN